MGKPKMSKFLMRKHGLTRAETEELLRAKDLILLLDEHYRWEMEHAVSSSSPLSRGKLMEMVRKGNPSKRLKWTQRVGQDPTTGQVQVMIRGRYPDTTFPYYEFIVTSAGDDNWKLEQKTPKYQLVGFFDTAEEAQERADVLVSKKNPRKRSSKTSKKRVRSKKKVNVRTLVSKALR